MRVSRTGPLALVALVALGSGWALRLRWPSSRPALDCPAAAVRWVHSGGAAIATCRPGAPLERGPAGPALTLGTKLDLNQATVEELRLLSGIGPSLASALVNARAERNGFRAWDEVDAVVGVGPAKLDTLKRSTELGPPRSP